MNSKFVRSLIFSLIFSITAQTYCSVDWNQFNPLILSSKLFNACIGLFYYFKPKPVPDAQKLPIVFHPNYDIGFFGIEKLHPFDSKKYGKVADHLKQSLNVTSEHFFKPKNTVADEDLKKIHTPEYLDSLNSSATVQKIAEVPGLQLLPNWIIQWKLLNPMKYATQGTIDAAQLALERGAAINLSGGYHHAKSETGGGFCVYADIPLALTKLREQNPNLKAMYVDLDAHQGNGVESILEKDVNSYIVDCYNEYNYPWDRKAEQRIDMPIKSSAIYCENCKNGASQKNCQDCNNAYMNSLKHKLPQAIQEFERQYHQKPDIIFYNAGTDCFEEDMLGRMKLTQQGIIDRDEFVFEKAKEHQIPICMTLSGGYSKKSAAIIGASIVNLHQKKLLEQEKEN